MSRPSPAFLREALDYDRETGLLRWKIRPVSHFGSPQDAIRWNAQFAGKPAFAGVDKDGYFEGTINDRRYRAHRVIFAMLHDRWPALEVDHHDTCRTNNRPNNLREATTAQNRQNESLRAKSNGLPKGVYRNNPKSVKATYQARIQRDGQYRYLGTFPTVEQAHAAYCVAASQLFGDFARAA